MKYTFEKDIMISATVTISVDAESSEEAVKNANEEGFSLMDMCDGSIQATATSNYCSDLSLGGDEFEDFTIDEISKEE